METLKDKAKKKRDKRQERKVIQTPVETIKPELNTPANIATQRVTDRKAIEPAPAAIVGVNTPDLGKPEALAVRKYQDRGAIEKANPTAIVTPTQVAAQNPSGGITNANIEAAKTAIAEANKPLTLSDLLEKQRKKAETEKTDAAKMQKYYALTDALNALGKIGGSVVGGAVGGNVMDSAPAVPEYKESRGYLDAFEKAKQANDRLRELDDMEYNLALKDEERSYKQQEAKLEREYRKQLLDYENQLKQAQAQRNYDLELALKTKIENLTHEHKMAQEKLKGEYVLREKDKSKEIVTIQNQSRGMDKDYIPMAMANGKGVMIPKSYYEDMLDFYIGEVIGGETATKDNVKSLIRKNPQLVNNYLAMFGYMDEEDTPETKSTETPKKTPYSGPSSRIDYADEAMRKAVESGAYDEEEKPEDTSMEAKKNKWRNRN